MVKRKMKKAIKQKQKQNVNVKQNVKVVVGEIKKKRAVKSSGAKSGAKPPIVLNISNPQPQNNILMEYFKKQLQNQQPVQGNTLLQQEKINEREETKASKAGALHRLDQEPNDVARELRRQASEQRARYQQAEADRKSEEREMTSSIRKIPKEPTQTNVAPRIRQPQATPAVQMIKQEEPAEITQESMVLKELEEQQGRLEREIEKPGGAGGAGAESVAPAKKRGAPFKSQEAKDETARRQAERKEMMKNDPYEKAVAKAKRQANKILKARAEAMSPKFPTMIK